MKGVGKDSSRIQSREQEKSEAGSRESYRRPLTSSMGLSVSKLPVPGMHEHFQMPAYRNLLFRRANQLIAEVSPRHKTINHEQ